ncbi:glycoside hydrolase family 6 protein [Viridothelium virens]|uniref:Glucanase n=1 Tax=Viridothelium virens TaxID=1048519 RepID=A0A6A6H1S6_VIRVR|nr:glycoside hydrolase family 6 protein [Viridothelium virens]
MAPLASTLAAFTAILAAVQASPVATGAASPAAPAASAATTGGSTVGNPFTGKQIYANPYYASEILSSAVPSLSAPYNTKASSVAKVGTFAWLDSTAKVPSMGTYLADIQKQNAAGASPPIIGAFVVYDLPNRDCSAAASNGEFSVANNGLANYEKYIDSIKAQLQAYPSVDTVLLIEPDSLANLVTNLNVANCSAAESAYKAGVTYAMQQLNLPNVAMYLDAGHAGWLGWSANIGPAAQLFGSLYTSAGSPSQVRGLATNVANYNGFNLASAPSYTSGDSNYDEKLYINALAPLLTQQGFPAHFITDTSRNGVQPTKQQAWGDWCNVVGTGFGVRPTTNTGDALADAFVWVKPGGECDGTSDSSAPRYDYHCSLSDALQPSPQAGTWFQAYFAQLLENANPSF